MSLASPTLEASLLGAALLGAPVAERLVVDHELDTAHFTEPLHREAWDAIRSTWLETGTVDLAAIATRLPDRTPISAVEALVAEACGPEAVRDVATRLIRLALRRTWRDAAHAMLEAAGDDDERHVERAQAILRTEHGIDSDQWTVARMQTDVFDWLSSKDPVGITTGYPVIDKAIGGGMRPGDMTAIGGWTGHGKSLLLDDILMAAAAAGHKAHLFINEMSPRDRALRLIAKQGAAPHAKLVRRDLDSTQLESVVETAGRIPFSITECSTWTAERIARSIRSGGWDVVGLDILHNLPFKDTRELDEAVGVLLGAALSSGTHLILVCHLNDERAKMAIPPPPVLRDIRNSGMVARACASVLMLNRELHDEGGFVSQLPEGFIDVVKHRHGQPATAKVRLDVDRLRFDDVTPWRAAA